LSTTFPKYGVDTLRTFVDQWQEYGTAPLSRWTVEWFCLSARQQITAARYASIYAGLLAWKIFDNIIML
jgi:hypothetical protein